MKKQGWIVFIVAVVLGMGLGYLLIHWLAGPTPFEPASTLPQTVEPVPTPTPDPSPVQVTLTTSDAITLTATYYPPLDLTPEGARALLLLHEAHQDKSSWDAFAKKAQIAGYAVLALDLRGHGGSGGEKTFDALMDEDVAAGLAWLRGNQAINAGKMGIVGASLGANLALRGGARFADVKSLALLSPGMTLWDIDIAEAIIDYGPRPVLLVTSEEDEYPRDSAQLLNEQALGEHRLQIYPGAEHGTKLIESHPELSLLLLDWFNQTIP